MHNFLPDQNMGDYTSGSDDEDGHGGQDFTPLISFIEVPGSAEEDEAIEAESAPMVSAPKESEEEDNWRYTDSEDEEEAGATIEEVLQVEPALEATRDQPPDIDVSAAVIDVKFHPGTNLLAAATLEGEVICYRYDSTKSEEIHSSEHHDSALRSILFNHDGSCLYTASKDKSVAVLDTATWAVKRHYVHGHDASVYSLCDVNEYVFASGDDEGTLKLWDVRREAPVFSIKSGEETINAMIVDDQGKTLVAALNDGSIFALNLRKKKLIVESEMYDYPLTCLAIVRNGTRLAVGSENGNMHIFNWGEFAYHAVCVADQPQQINCMQAVGDNRIITGCEDGYIRAVNLEPHRFVGVVGRHEKYGVEGISISCDQRYLASCCQDEVVRFWDLQHLYSVQTDGRQKGCKTKDLRNHLKSSRERNAVEFFQDLDEKIPSDDEYMGPVDRPKNIE